MEWKKAQSLITQFPWAELALWRYADLIYERYLGGVPTQDEYPRHVQLAALRKWVAERITYMAVRPFDSLPLNVEVFHSNFALAGIRPITMDVCSEITVWYKGFGEDSFRGHQGDYDGSSNGRRVPHSAADVIENVMREMGSGQIEWCGISHEFTIEVDAARNRGVWVYDFYPFPGNWDPKTCAGITI